MSKAVQPLKSKSDIERIKKSLHGRDLLLFIIGINTTLRISDILELRVKDVSSDYIEIKERKTSKIKRIKVNNSIKEAVNNLVPAIGYFLLEKDRILLAASKHGVY